MSNFLNNANKNWSVVAGQIQNQDATGIVKIGPSYFQVPVGPSGDRPTTGLDNGFIRFNTSDNFLEYYSVISSNWIGISVPPVVNSVSPLILTDLSLSSSVTDSSINIIGSNFGSTPTVIFIDTADNEYISPITSSISPTLLNATVPQSVFDNSNLEPFKVKVTNAASLNFTTGAILFINGAPIITTTPVFPNLLAIIPRNTILTGQLDISGYDVDHTIGVDLSFSSPDLSFNTSALIDMSFNGVVSGTTNNVANGTIQTINFQANLSDPNVTVSSNYRFQVFSEYTFSNTGTLDISYASSIYGISDTSSNKYDNGGTILKYTTGTGSFTPNYDMDVQYLVVAGGGGGGNGYQAGVSTDGMGGGGGAGGFVTGFYPVSANQTYNITVGNGGAAGNNTDGTSGANSSFGTGGLIINAVGGGGGGSGGTAANSRVGLPGGSGGGAGGRGDKSGGSTTQVSTYGYGYGNNGGNSMSTDSGAGAGGGGGASEPGQRGGLATAGTQGATTNNNRGGDGGDGAISDITGQELHYAGGGGGSNFSVTAAYGRGGLGGGGDAGQYNPVTSAENGETNTGGGGGGAYGTATSGNGGSGAVILRFPTYGPTIPVKNLLQVLTNSNGDLSITYLDPVNGIQNAPIPYGDTVYSFYTSNNFIDSSFTFKPTQNISDCSCLVVAGGGGGGCSLIAGLNGGGGGAGGYTLSNVSFLSSDTYTVQVGGGGLAGFPIENGGSGASAAGTSGFNGGNSFLIHSSGRIDCSGGGGGCGEVDSGVPAGTGGSGGGGKGGNAGGTNNNTGANANGVGDGNNGGDGNSTVQPFGGGGGGGAGTVGSSPTTGGGNGGTGKSNDLAGGSIIFYAGGGGGGTNNSTIGTGGQGGGGNGGYDSTGVGRNTYGVNATSRTGGGGGGGGDGENWSSAAGYGGSGLVLLRFPTFINPSATNINHISILSNTNGEISITYLDSNNLIAPGPVSNGYSVYSFKNLTNATTSTFTVSYPNSINEYLQYLVIGGGGGGGSGLIGNSYGGGGGAGGYLFGYGGITNKSSYGIQVGAGGLAGSTSSAGSNGVDSYFDIFDISGGGGGAGYTNGQIAKSGSSGGGGSYGQNGTTPNQNHIPGNNLVSTNGLGQANGYSGARYAITGGGGQGSGGGGVNSRGGILNSNNNDGGSGLTLTVTGSSVIYSRGGDGTPGGTGGITNTGMGGVGGRNVGGEEPGDGGSGIVILKFPSFAFSTTPNRLNISNINNGMVNVTYVNASNNVVYYPISGGSTIYSFTPVQFFTPQPNASFTITPTVGVSCEYLIVGGGGGGGGGHGGGGGAGGLLTNYGSTPVYISSATTVEVGVGGIGGVGYGAGTGTGVSGGNVTGQTGRGVSGGDSRFGIYDVSGGGYGGGYNNNGFQLANGGDGGSGGGAAGQNASPGGTVTDVTEGNAGGSTTSSGGAGGGGAGGGGTNSATGSGTNGGASVTSVITGSTVYYAGGGGGGAGVGQTAGTGGTQSGGNGFTGTNDTGKTGGDGINFTGGGGGGGTGGTTIPPFGGNGGSGIVVIRFPSFS